MKKYSIILPVRNGGSLVKECVNSILAQTYKDFDLIVLDNQSTDGTVGWIESLQDERIKIFTSGQSLGIVENWARIKGIPKNEFITLIGHDDILYPKYLTVMDSLIAKHSGASLYQTHFDYIDGQGTFTHPCMPMDELQVQHEFVACQLARTIDSMGTGYMMRAADFDRLGGMPVNYPNLIFADYQLFMQLTGLSYKACSPEFCFSYRVHDSVSRLTNGYEYQEAFSTYIKFLDSLKEGKPGIQNVIKHYGHDYLMYFCESLSHRILKSKHSETGISVEGFIANCVKLAALFIPGQPFEPMKKKRISLAATLDKSAITREAFMLVKKVIK